MTIEVKSKFVLFVVRKGEENIELAHASPYDALIADFQDLRANVPWHELKRLVGRIPCRVEEDVIHPAELEDYDRFVIYCGVRPSVKQTTVSDLTEVVLGLNGYDVSYWSMHFKKAFWAGNSSESVARTANAFKQLFGLV